MNQRPLTSKARPDKSLPAKRLLRRVELTQFDVAEEAGVSQSLVSLTLSGRLRSPKVVNALRTLLGDDFTEAEMFGGES